MNDALDTTLVLELGEKPSVQYRSSPYTVRQYCALPYAQRRAVDADCDERAALTYTTHDDETSEKPYTVGRRTIAPSPLIAQPASPMSTAYVHPAPSPALHYLNTPERIAHDAAHPDNEHTFALPARPAQATHYDLASVVSRYVTLTPTEGDTEWTHWGPSPFLGGGTHSFAVNTDKGRYKCFTSTRSGGVVDLVMFMEECSEAEALVWLAAHFSESDSQPEVLTPAPVAEGADGPACAYLGYPKPAPEVVHENGLPLTSVPFPVGEGGAPAFAELAQATAEAVAPTAPAAPVAVDGTIYATTDYDMFHLLPQNRVVKQSDVRLLVAQISERNLLHTQPLDVTADMGIIDGQHRLAAARELGVPVYYKIGEELSEADIIALNVARKNWQGTDYLHFYTVKGRPDYAALTDFMQRHPMLSFSNAKMMLGATNKGSNEEFRKGLWKAGEGSKAEQVAGFIERIAAEVPTFKHPTHTGFVGAVFHCVMNVKGFDSKEFMHKILKNPRMLVNCASLKQFLTMFEEIYNFRTNVENRLRF